MDGNLALKKCILGPEAISFPDLDTVSKYPNIPLSFESLVFPILIKMPYTVL